MCKQELTWPYYLGWAGTLVAVLVAASGLVWGVVPELVPLGLDAAGVGAWSALVILWDREAPLRTSGMRVLNA